MTATGPTRPREDEAPRSVPAVANGGATEEPLLIDERAAARLLGISPRLVWSLRVSGQLPFVRVRSRILYSPQRLLEWVEHNTTEGRRR